MSDNSIIGILLAIVIGLAFAGGGGYMYYGQQQAVQNAEPVDATILETNIEKDVSTDDDGDREVSFDVGIQYEYTVDGERKTSDTIWPAGVGKSFDQRSSAEDFLSDYQEGSQVTAYYNPETDDAFLVKKKSTGLLLFAGFGGLFALLGIAGLGKKVLGLAF